MVWKVGYFEVGIPTAWSEDLTRGNDYNTGPTLSGILDSCPERPDVVVLLTPVTDPVVSPVVRNTFCLPLLGSASGNRLTRVYTDTHRRASACIRVFERWDL